MSVPSSEGGTPGQGGTPDQGGGPGQGGGPETGRGRLESVAEAEENLRRAATNNPRPRMNLQQIQSWVDVEIEQAQRRGDFDNLPGAGKPLKNLDHSDPDWWVKSLIEREQLDLSSALPTVMALRQERRGFPESLAGISDEIAVRERLEDYNARVIEDRRKPVVGTSSPAIAGRVDVDEMVQQWRQLRQDRSRPVADPDAAPHPQREADTQPAPEPGHTQVWIALLAVLALGVLIWVLS